MNQKILKRIFCEEKYFFYIIEMCQDIFLLSFDSLPHVIVENGQMLSILYTVKK